LSRINATIFPQCLQIKNFCFMCHSSLHKVYPDKTQSCMGKLNMPAAPMHTMASGRICPCIVDTLFFPVPHRINLLFLFSCCLTDWNLLIFFYR
jgi:hypothetical protein